MCPEKCLTKIMGKKENLIWKKHEKKILLEKILGLKKNCWSEKNLGPKEIWVQNVFFGSNKISSLKTLGPNENLCLEKVLSKNILVHKNYDPKKLGPKSLVKIGPVTA